MQIKVLGNRAPQARAVRDHVVKSAVHEAQLQVRPFPPFMFVGEDDKFENETEDVIWESFDPPAELKRHEYPFQSGRRVAERLLESVKKIPNFGERL